MQYVLQASIEAVEEVIQELASDSGDRSDDGMHSGTAVCRSAGQEERNPQLLAQRLSAGSVHVKLQALFLIEQLVGAGVSTSKLRRRKA